ncbi:MAG: hypothetical protein HW382_601 [Deltaproteobacteria bacterium]|nr:hypothetical protein [Deltaproteobacteria bacterium]
MFIFSSASIMLASIGIVLAVTSFISGLQLVRATRASIEGMIHRANGYLTVILFIVILFIVLTLIAISSSMINIAALLLPLTGLAVFLVKLWIVRRHKRFLKYVSWMGGTLITIWLLVFYINIPV